MSKGTIHSVFPYLLVATIVSVASYHFVLWFRTAAPLRTYVVQSGSMEPSIMTGDVIIITKQNVYKKNDVITFKDSAKRTITHRIVEQIDGSPGSFTTKGDANQTADSERVLMENIIGKVTTVIPKFGYVVHFVKSRWGVVFCIIMPTTLILYDEIRAILNKPKVKKH